MFQTEVTPIPFRPDASTIHVRGEVRYREAAELRERLLAQIAGSDSNRLVLELAGIEEMDTSGAAVLVEALIAGRNRGIKVLFCSPSPSVVELFRLAGFEEALEACCPTPAETKRRLLE